PTPRGSKCGRAIHRCLATAASWSKAARAGIERKPTKGRRQEQPHGLPVPIVFHLGSRNQPLPTPAPPLRPATLVARTRRVRGDRRRIAHAADGMAECRRGDSEPEGGGPPRCARARSGPCSGHSETRENRGSVSDQAPTPP